MAQERTDAPADSGEPAKALAVPATEAVNLLSGEIDVKTPLEIVQIIHREDLRAWEAVGSALTTIAEAVEVVANCFRAGGSLYYVGAGTSGRLGVLDAAECPPTFGVPPERVRGIIAGGEAALRMAVEGAEDSGEAGARAIREAGIRSQDVVCGIAASGTTPFVWGALEEAVSRDATTVLITCNPEWPRGARGAMIDFVIVLPVGPEIIAGSTRMKAGTATKLVLNTVSTAAMIRWGKVYDNLMVDLTPLSRKLERRALGLVAQIVGVELARAAELLKAADWDVKTAVVIGRSGLGAPEARERLRAHGGILRRALEGEREDGPDEPGISPR